MLITITLRAAAVPARELPGGTLNLQRFGCQVHGAFGPRLQGDRVSPNTSML
jgi:hypothetical protein